MASEEEREAMAAMCIWVGDTKAAKLFSMSTLMYHLVARSIEAASLRKSRIGLVRKEESGNKYSILNIGMERTKTETSMNPHLLYPHRDTLLFDSYFAIAYVLIMDSKSANDFIFPDFADKIHNGSKDINSKTANLFNSYADWLNNISYDYSE